MPSQGPNENEAVYSSQHRFVSIWLLARASQKKKRKERSGEDTLPSIESVLIYMGVGRRKIELERQGGEKEGRGRTVVGIARDPIGPALLDSHAKRDRYQSGCGHRLWFKGKWTGPERSVFYCIRDTMIRYIRDGRPRRGVIEGEGVGPRTGDLIELDRWPATIRRNDQVGSGCRSGVRRGIGVGTAS